MKRLYTSLIVLFIILSVSFFTIIQCKNLCSEAYSQVLQIKENTKSDRPQEAVAMAQQFYKFWNKSKNSMVWYIRHEPLEKITALSSRLEALIQNDDLAMLEAYCDELLVRINELYHNEIPKLHNLI